MSSIRKEDIRIRKREAMAMQKARTGTQLAEAGGDEVEFKPHFHEWATVLPGMICVSRKARNSTFRNYVAAETATPVRKKAPKANSCYPVHS